MITLGDALYPEDVKCTADEVIEVPGSADTPANNVGTINDKSTPKTIEEDPERASKTNPIGSPNTIKVAPKLTIKVC